jgi:hypothetical protein
MRSKADCSQFDHNTDLWGSKAMCIKRDACEKLCGMVGECHACISHQEKARSYMVTSTCAPRNIDQKIEEFRYIPDDDEDEDDYSCQSYHDTSASATMHGHNRALAEKRDAGTSWWSWLFGATDADGEFDVADALREGMFKFDHEL